MAQIAPKVTRILYPRNFCLQSPPHKGFRVLHWNRSHTLTPTDTCLFVEGVTRRFQGKGVLPMSGMVFLNLWCLLAF